MSEKIVNRDCINWSNNDHCAVYKTNYCYPNCGKRWPDVKQETVADIVAELRQDYKGRPPINRAETTWCRRSIADRIEAAHTREVGNGAKLREALEDAKKSAFGIIDALRTPCRVNLATNIANYITGVCSQALAAPRRNCDVGTAEEQRRRYDEWRNHDGSRAALGKDEFDWAQMPYESEVKK